MAKTISSQIEDLEKDIVRLRSLDKIFEKAIKLEFGYDRKTIHKILENYKESLACQMQGQIKNGTAFFIERGAAPFIRSAVRQRGTYAMVVAE